MICLYDMIMEALCYCVYKKVSLPNVLQFTYRLKNAQ